MRFSLRSLLFSFGLWSGLVGTATVTAQQTASVMTVSVRNSKIEQLISDGSEFELKQLWGDALTHYEHAVKEYPDDRNLKQRFVNAKIHYDLQRRYVDPTYLQSLSSTTEQAAFEIYAEVLLKIQTHYVDTPDWEQIGRRGVMNLDAALFEPAFQQANQLSVSAQKLHAAQLALHRAVDGRQVTDRTTAFQLAQVATQVLQQHLRLAPSAIVLEFVTGSVSSLDQYSAYLTADQYAEIMSHIEGNFVGLGVEIRPETDALEIVDVIRSGPAGMAGLRKGDRITAIDGKTVVEVGGEAAAEMLRGLEGSTVQIVAQRADGKAFQWNIRRERVEIPSVEEVRIVNSQDGVAYLKLSNFQKTTVKDFDQALWQLHNQGMRSLVVDLRGNPGGLLTAAVDLADRFVHQGVIVSTRGRNPHEDFVHRAEEPGTWRVPLTVLIDHNSASASEIFAGAIHDHRRGTLVGERSYGKGSVQGIFPLSFSRGGVRLTTAKFYSPVGDAISDRGVTPDLAVQYVAKANLENANQVAQQAADEMLETAIRVAADKANGR